MKNIFRAILISVISLFLLSITLISLASPEKVDQKLKVSTLIAASPVVKEIIPEIDNAPFRDNPDLYQDDDPSSVVYMYVTVRVGNSSDNTAHTWQEVNDFVKWTDKGPTYIVVGKAEAILQVGDENGPLPGELGYGETVPNATIQLRGNSTSAKAQKSYKIELRSRAGTWRGQSTINLNKHVFDITRARNKLSFDLIKQIPNMVSLRTQYVRLFVKDETADPAKVTFVDYGLYTQVEQPNTKFLRSHLLDPDGQLYKATFFEFFRYPDQIRLADDPLYDEEAFSKILEVKGNKDHSKLIRMLDDVNDPTIPIEQTFEKYFNADNYFTWMAFNILMGNLDTQSQNFFLYSPRNGNKWYFIPWDYDGDLARQFGFYIYDDFESGVANYWGVPLHKRVLKIARYRQMLDEKVNELMDFLSSDRMEGMLKEYKKVTDVYSLQMPDLYYLRGSVNDYENEYALIPKEIKLNYDLYLKSLKSPMPIFLGTPKVSENSLVFTWDESYDFNAQDISYHFILSKDWEFHNIVFEETLINTTTLKIDALEPGTYFWQVSATNEEGNTQYPFNTYWDAEAIIHRGLKYLYITSDGKVLEE
ncbi:MAG TPA: CotH kinase family protein [Anaerolineales bacterium]|nr:CotH kinase family protein [Anaerolineales bacterium]